jgi:hypothetical protein
MWRCFQLTGLLRRLTAQDTFSLGMYLQRGLPKVAEWASYKRMMLLSELCSATISQRYRDLGGAMSLGRALYIASSRLHLAVPGIPPGRHFTQS